MSSMTQAAFEIPRGMILTGAVEAAEDITVRGRITGDVLAPAHAVSITEGARVDGTITARDVTIAGQTEGTVLAEVVDIRASAHVTGRLLTPHVILQEGASFNGTVEPDRADAARRVGEYRRRPSPAVP